MIAPRRLALLVAAGLLAAGGGGAALVVAQATAPERSETVNGWRVEQVADAEEANGASRIIRMSREAGGHRMQYEVRVGSGWSGSGGDGWAGAGFSAGGFYQGTSCSESGSAAAETGPPEARAGRVRAELARRLRELERQCGSPAGTSGALLDGFEGGFALLSAWHDLRVAENAAAAAESDSTMDMNTVDMGMDANMMDWNSSETNVTYYEAEAVMNAVEEPQ